MNCETCLERRKQAEPVPYLVHEADMARQERTNKRLTWIVILLIVLLVASNFGWIWYESQFVDESWSWDASSEDGNAIANGFGEVYFYGESESDGEPETPQMER